jgi:cell division ATPase FtsA
MRLCNWFAGIDINSRAIIATFGSSTDDGRPRVHGSSVVELQYTSDRTHQDTQSLRNAVRQLGEWLRLESGGNLEEAALTVPGNVIQEMPSSGECRFSAPTVIDAETVEIARRKALRGPGMLGPVLCSTIRSYECDGRRSAVAPIGMSGISFRVEIVAWVVQTSFIRPVADALTNAGFQPGVIAPRAVAIAETALTRSEREGGALLVCANDGFTEVATFVDAQLADLFVVPLGKSALETQLSRACGVPIELVRRLDLQRMLNSSEDDAIVHRVRTILSAWGTSLFTAIRRRLDGGDFTWRLQAGIVIADSAGAVPTLASTATRVMGRPARFAVSTQSITPRTVAVGEPLAAVGLIPLQWKTNGRHRDQGEAPLPVVNMHVPSEIESRGIIERKGLAPVIGRWLREFIPADHSL